MILQLNTQSQLTSCTQEEQLYFRQREKQLGSTKLQFFSAPMLKQGIVALISAEPHPGGLTSFPEPNTTLLLNTALRLRNVGSFSSVASSGLQGSSKQTIFFQTLSRSANNKSNRAVLSLGAFQLSVSLDWLMGFIEI